MFSCQTFSVIVFGRRRGWVRRRGETVHTSMMHRHHHHSLVPNGSKSAKIDFTWCYFKGFLGGWVSQTPHRIRQMVTVGVALLTNSFSGSYYSPMRSFSGQDFSRPKEVLMPAIAHTSNPLPQVRFQASILNMPYISVFIIKFYR